MNDLINNILSEYVYQLTGDREKMILQLLSHALEGDKLILCEQHLNDEQRTIKHQFTWESGELIRQEYSHKADLAEAVGLLEKSASRLEKIISAWDCDCEAEGCRCGYTETVREAETYRAFIERVKGETK